MSQIEKPDDLQLLQIIRFFCMHDAFHDGNNQKETVGKFLVR